MKSDRFTAKRDTPPQVFPSITDAIGREPRGRGPIRLLRAYWLYSQNARERVGFIVEEYASDFGSRSKPATLAGVTVVATTSDFSSSAGCRTSISDSMIQRIPTLSSDIAIRQDQPQVVRR